MAQHDYVIDNSTGANVRADINSVLQAIASNNSGSSAPSSTFALQFYADTTSNILKLRNAANDGFINLFTLAGGVDVDAASNFNEDVTFQCASGTIVFDKSANDLTFSDSVKARFGDSNDLTIFHDGSNSHIEDAGTGSLLIKGDGVSIGASSGEFYFRGFENGASSLRFDNNGRLETTATGVNFLGNLTSSSNTTFTISAGGSGTAGHVSLKCGSEDAFLGRPNGSTELFHDNAKKFETTSSGVNVTGDLEASGFIQVPDASGTNGHIFIGSQGDLNIFHDGSNSFIANTTGTLVVSSLAQTTVKGSTVQFENAAGTEVLLKANQDAAVELYHDGSKKVETTSQGIQNFGSGNGNGHYHFINTTANVNRHVDFSFQRIGGSNRGTTAIIHVGENSNAQGEIIMASSGSNAGLSGGVIMNNGATSFSSNSDTRLKNKISDITDALTNIKQIDTWKYSWKDDTSNTPKLGVTAQSVQSVYPEVVGKRAKLKDNSDLTEYLNVAYTELIPVCIAAIKELSAKVEALEGA